MTVRSRALLLLLLLVAITGGCAAPTATLDLVTVARKGLDAARQDADQQHTELVQRLKANQVGMDSAFDADVRLAAAGQIISADGKPVELSPEWVISARKGYVAARDLLGEQTRLAQAAHATSQDNLAAADEALEMASQLIVQQWNVAERIKQHVLTIQRSLIHD